MPGPTRMEPVGWTKRSVSTKPVCKGHGAPKEGGRSKQHLHEVDVASHEVARQPPAAHKKDNPN